MQQTMKLPYFSIIFILCCVQYVVCDEARAIVADSVSRSHQEVVPPESDDHDAVTNDGPIVSPIHPGDHKGYLDILTSKENEHETPHRYPFIRMDFSKAKPLIITLWILIASLSKFGKSRICFDAFVTDAIYKNVNFCRLFK